MTKKKTIGLSLAALLLIAAIWFCGWFFSAGRTLDRAEALLNAGDTPSAVALVDTVSYKKSEKTLYRSAVLYNKAGAVDALEAVTQKMVEIAPDDPRTFAVRLMLDWAKDTGARDAIYAEAAAKGIDLSEFAPNTPATKEADGAVLAPLTEVEIFPYRSEETVYLEINGSKANRFSPKYSTPLVAVYGDYPISAVSLNADGVPSPTLSRTLRVTEETNVPFSDPTFEAVILGTLDETLWREVTNRELRALDGLILNAMIGEAFFADEFKSFYDLRYFAHIERLGISQSEEIQDLSALSGLYGLKHFSLYGPVEQNFDTIASLRSLRSLSLERSSADLSLVREMPALTALAVTVGDYTDLSGLSRLKNLTTLRLDYHKIQDLTPLAGLTNLETLNLYDNEITDLSPLAQLPKLKALDVRQNPVTDPGGLTVETLLIGE